MTCAAIRCSVTSTDDSVGERKPLTYCWKAWVLVRCARPIAAMLTPSTPCSRRTWTTPSAMRSNGLIDEGRRSGALKRSIQQRCHGAAGHRGPLPQASVSAAGAAGEID